MFAPTIRLALAGFAVVLLPALARAQAAEEMKRAVLKAPTKHGYNHLVFSPDGKLLAAGSYQGSVISVIDVATAKEQVRLQLPHDNYEYRLTFSADCRTLVSVGREDAKIRIWDVVTGKQLREFRKPVKNCLALAPGGKRLLGTDRGLGSNLALYDVESGRVVWKVDGFRLEHNVSGFGACAFSPDGETLAVHGINREVQIWNALTGEFVRAMDPGDRYATGAFKFVSFSPDGKLIATGGHTDDSLHVWDVATGKERLRIKLKKDGWIFSASFSPDGTLMAYAGFDGFHLYDLREGKAIMRLPGLGGVFSADGALLAVPTRSKAEEPTLTFYDMPRRGKDQLPRQLNAEQLGVLWQDLTADNDFRLQRVLASFRAAPGDAVPFLGKKLTPASEADRKRVKALLEDLDADVRN